LDKTHKRLLFVLPGGLLKLEKELFKTTKPGLSAYANDPQRVRFAMELENAIGI
jgi:hypothetical protein